MVTIHDTATDGTVPFNANAAAKQLSHAFKRPEKDNSVQEEFL